MRRRHPRIRLVSLPCFPIFLSLSLTAFLPPAARASGPPLPAVAASTRSPRLIIPTFLGDGSRNYYGDSAPSRLTPIWKAYLGKGVTVISRRLGSREWAGAGFTGQPLLVEEDGDLFLIQGSYDHSLRKIDARTGRFVWEYRFDDVVKATGTLWENPGGDPADRLVIIQGSRLGVENPFDAPRIPSLRAISYSSGKELWRLNVRMTQSYSRDVDASALVAGGKVYIGLENSLFTILDPDPRQATVREGMLQPRILGEQLLYREEDVISHRHNVTTESSPTLLDGVVYVPSGSGRVWGYDTAQGRLSWEFPIGSDLNGTAPATYDHCLLVSVEKQYIPGRGGMFKLDPGKDPSRAAVWYFPVADHVFAGWEGGVIGSPAVNDLYPQSSWGHLAAFLGIDGFLYVVRHDETEEGWMVAGPDGATLYPVPRLVFKKFVGPSISTPIFVQDKLVAATCQGVYLFSYDQDLRFTLLDHLTAPFEATPVAHRGRIYVASRDGFLYCLGEKTAAAPASAAGEGNPPGPVIRIWTP